jgi:outer membrane protein assembly factor BamD
MKKILRFSAVLILTVSLFACKSQYEALLNSTDSDAKYAAAFEFFNQGKYNKAAQLFESLSTITSGTDRDDTVQYYWGLSNYRSRDYYTAETNFSNFMMNFPRSPFNETATFLRLDCLYRSTLRYELDQVPTHSAISAITEYVSEYPDSPYLEVCNNMLTDLNERLDRKAFESAKLYYRMEDYKAAQVALRNVLKEDSDNLYREDVLYYTAMASYKYADLSVNAKKKERFMTFVDDYLNFIGEFPESKHRNELDGNYRRARKFLGTLTGAAAESDVPEEENIEK